ncbi:metal ABC transporter permease [Verticiella sediminum]|uniref:Metal ABC transporter permease n=1 Tax=Verticiella sediminum TaxID=1247510 RepID=A0A556AYG7_9BURK|nr:metal ABC transporter permease [Verticiella sediminum]TSH97990.1 metal ABC transporter permease [Verticiella sediminum]
MSLYDLAIAPFQDFVFMRRALAAVFALALGSAPLGVLLTLRRMSLAGDALAHAVLPGVAVAFIVFGLSLPALSIGGFLAGVLVVLAAVWVSRYTDLKEDASFAAGYLVALAAGVLLISSHGTQIDLLHILFGNILGVDRVGLVLVTGVSSVTLVGLALFYRAFLLESFDPAYLRSITGGGGLFQFLFLMLVVANLVAAFQVMGTLMAVGLMMLPAVSARLWHAMLPAQLLNAALQALLAGYAGLLLSYHFDQPSGPVIVMCSGALYALSLLLAPQGWRGRRKAHLHAEAVAQGHLHHDHEHHSHLH